MAFTRKEILKRFCENHPDYYAARMRDYRKNNKETFKIADKLSKNSLNSNGIKRSLASQIHKYGLTDEDYISMLSVLSGCAICGKIPDGEFNQTSRLHIDHDHDTGRVRGLLCHGCNIGMGHFKDNAKLLLAAANYLTGEI